MVHVWWGHTCEHTDFSLCDPPVPSWLFSDSKGQGLCHTVGAGQAGVSGSLILPRPKGPASMLPVALGWATVRAIPTVVGTGTLLLCAALGERSAEAGRP